MTGLSGVTLYVILNPSVMIADLQLQYYATDSADGLTTQSGADTDVRGAFASNGKLDNSKDSNFRAISDAWPVFAHAIDLGSVGSTATSTLFTIGLCQDSAIQFLGKDGITTIPSLWKSYFSDDLAAVSLTHPYTLYCANAKSIQAFILP